MTKETPFNPARIENRGKIGNKPTGLTDAVIEEVCGYLDRGATDICICRIMGFSPANFSRWKSYGRDDTTNPIYAKFLAAYEAHRGKRELHWIENIADPKWLITHHPDTKAAWAELRYLKGEQTNINIEEAAEQRRELRDKIDEDIEQLRKQIRSNSELIEVETSNEPEDGLGSDSSE